MDIFSLLDEIQTVARNGLAYSANPYDRERYERLLQVATDSYSALLDLPAGELRARFQRELGYITPKVGSDAAIFNEQGEILLMERADGSGWCLPCGWLDPNETPAEGVLREVREETGLEVVVSRLVGIYTRKPSAKDGPHSMVAVVHLCEIVGGELRLSHEGTALEYWPLDAMDEWHGIHERYARAAFEMWNSKELRPAISD